MIKQSQENQEICYLLNELVNGDHLEKLADEFYHKLDMLIKDPNWNEYIFWSDEFICSNREINYEKFLKKICNYEKTSKYKREQYIISLVNSLLEKDFQEKSEIGIVNELNELLSSTDWIDYLFVSRICLNQDGSLNRNSFLNMISV